MLKPQIQHFILIQLSPFCEIKSQKSFSKYTQIPRKFVCNEYESLKFVFVPNIYSYQKCIAMKLHSVCVYVCGVCVCVCV